MVVPTMRDRMRPAELLGLSAVFGAFAGLVVVFSDNVVSTGQVRSANQRLRREVRRPWPLLITVDQEGGLVQRVRGDATRLPTFMSAGAVA